jgi:hypothetical protein
MEGDPETEGRTRSAWRVCYSKCCDMGDGRRCGQRGTGHSVYCGEVTTTQGWLSRLRYQRKRVRGSSCTASGLILPHSLPLVIPKSPAIEDPNAIASVWEQLTNPRNQILRESLKYGIWPPPQSFNLQKPSFGLTKPQTAILVHLGSGHALVNMHLQQPINHWLTAPTAYFCSLRPLFPFRHTVLTRRSGTGDCTSPRAISH